MVPAWISGYERAWLRPDLIAGLVIWSVVTPQAVAYAQIAGLPPAAGLMAAPGALLAYALLGTSRQLVVGATTATAAVSAATIAPMAGGDAARFAALSAAFALVTAVAMWLAGAFKLGALVDLIPKSVMVGFLFGLGITIAVGQLPALLGVPAPDSSFFTKVGDLFGSLDAVSGNTVALGVCSAILLVLGRRAPPTVPATLIVLGLAIAVSAVLQLDEHGVATVGSIPDALPDPALPAGISFDDVVALVVPAFGVLILSAEGLGVARQLSVKHGYRIDANRELIAMGSSNLLSGLSSGFVQCGGASQTASADGAGARSQLANAICAGLLLLTGAWLAPLFEHLPMATLAAIVIVAVAGFFDVRELRRLHHVRPDAVLFSGLALFGVLVLGILQGLVIAAGAALLYVVQRVSRPDVGVLARDGHGVWGWASRHPGWTSPGGVVVVRCDGPLLYPNADVVRERTLALTRAHEPFAPVVVFDLSESAQLDVQSADSLKQLAQQLRGLGAELRLASVRAPAAGVLERAGVTRHATVWPTIDAAIAEGGRQAGTRA